MVKRKKQITKNKNKNKTLVHFSMFTKSGEIGTTGLKAAKLFEKELCESMKQTFISDFFEKK